jgi:hypothetical protein
MSPEMFRELRGLRARLVRQAAPAGTLSAVWDYVDEIDAWTVWDCVDDAWTGYRPQRGKAHESAEDLRDSLLKHFQQWPDDYRTVS